MKGVIIMSYIEIIDLTKTYISGEVETHALNGASLNINKGELLIIVGSSGAGKTTLLNLIGGMDSITSGSLIIDGNDISKYNERQLTKYRREDIGFIFQFYNLIPNITALENIEMATEIALKPFDPMDILKDVGLEDKAENFPAQLSGGQQQRIAIARAIAKNPKLLLCDEPTGALDYESGKMVLKIIQDIVINYKTTAIIITHNQALEAIGDHVIRMKNGKIEDEYYNEHPQSVDEIEW